MLLPPPAPPLPSLTPFTFFVHKDRLYLRFERTKLVSSLLHDSVGSRQSIPPFFSFHLQPLARPLYPYSPKGPNPLAHDAPMAQPPLFPAISHLPGFSQVQNVLLANPKPSHAPKPHFPYLIIAYRSTPSRSHTPSRLHLSRKLHLLPAHPLPLPSSQTPMSSPRQRIPSPPTLITSPRFDMNKLMTAIAREPRSGLELELPLVERKRDTRYRNSFAVLIGSREARVQGGWSGGRVRIYWDDELGRRVVPSRFG